MQYRQPKPRDPAPGYEERARGSFDRQGLMSHLGARVVRVEPGLVELAVSYGPHLTQQNGFFHAGVSSALADTAGGYAAFTLMPADCDVLTVEFKLNLLAPARGEELRAVAKVVKPGRTLSVCALEVYGVTDGVADLCANGQQTLMCIAPRPGA